MNMKADRTCSPRLFIVYIEGREAERTSRPSPVKFELAINLKTAKGLQDACSSLPGRVSGQGENL